MGCWAEGWVVWEAGVQVSWVEEFGLVLGSVELGISGEVEMGAVRENGGVSGCFWVGSSRGRMKKDCWKSGEVWGRKWKRFAGVWKAKEV